MERLIALAESRGLRVGFGNLGGLNGDVWKSGLIRINSTKTQVRQRVTLAHELGHHHYGHDWTRDHDRERDEREADQYAARLLIDYRTYADAERIVGCHPGALAKELGVTRRLVELWQADLAQDAHRFEIVERWRDEWAS